MLKIALETTVEIMTCSDDVLIEILLRLPAKSLTRIKSVSKHWHSLISAHQFCRLHALRHPKPQPSIIFPTYTLQFFYFHPIVKGRKLIPYSFTIPYSKILSSCNGLLLLQSYSPNTSYYAYNPTMKQSRMIYLAKDTNVVGLNLAFDPSKSPHYKIVCIRRKSSSDLEQYCWIEVYNSESHTWKLCLETFTASFHADFRFGVHCNNAIHWENFPHGYLYVSIDKNVIGHVPPARFPPCKGHRFHAYKYLLQESKSRLHNIIMFRNFNWDKSIAIYELLEDNSGWLLKYHDGFISNPIWQYIMRYVRGGATDDILHFIRGEDGETCTILTQVPGKIMAFRFLDKSCEELVDLTNLPSPPEEPHQFLSRDFHLFGESIAPV